VAAEPDPGARIDLVDAENRRRVVSEDRDRRRARVLEAAGQHPAAERGQQAGVGGPDREAAGLGLRHPIVAVHVRVDDLGGRRDIVHVVHLPDHRCGRPRQLDLGAGQALPVDHGQQVGAELVDLSEQMRLARPGHAEHRDDRGDPDRDAEGGQHRPDPPGPEAQGADRQQVGRS
jgi:hypothetical protein